MRRHLRCRKMFSMIKMRWKQRWGVEFTRQVSRLASRNPSEPALRRLINRFGGSWNVWKAKNVAATWDFQQFMFNFWERPGWHSGYFGVGEIIWHWINREIPQIKFHPWLYFKSQRCGLQYELHVNWWILWLIKYFFENLLEPQWPCWSNINFLTLRFLVTSCVQILTITCLIVSLH